MAAATATLRERRPGRIGMHSRACAARCTASGTPADSRPNSKMSSRGRHGPDRRWRRPVVSSTRRTPAACPPGLECREARVPLDRHLVEIVHPGAAEGAVGDREAGRLDDMGGHAEAGRQAQDGAGVLGDVGLIERDPHRRDPSRRPIRLAGPPRQDANCWRFLSKAWALGRWRTCAPPSRVPIERRWVVPLGLPSPGWKAAGSPATAG